MNENFETGVRGLSPRMGPHPPGVDSVHVRRETMGYGVFPPGRRQPALAGDELARQLINLSAPQIVHSALVRRRGMEGKVDAYDGTPRIRAVHRHSYGLGPLVTRPADLGADPLDTPVAHDYRRAPEGPRPDVLSKYVDARRHLPELTEGSGYPRLPRYHQLSPQVCMGDDLYQPFNERGQQR